MMLARLTLKSAAIAEIVCPLDIRSKISGFTVSLTTAGRPSFLPSCFARANPALVRSINRSRSNCANALSILRYSLPLALVRSMSPSARQCTLILRLSNSLNVASTSIASRPKRSSFVTTSTSPSSILSNSAAKPLRCETDTLPETVSETIREGNTSKPALVTSST